MPRSRTLRHLSGWTTLAFPLAFAACRATDGTLLEPPRSVATDAVHANGSLQFVPINLPIDLTPDGSTALLEDVGSPEGIFYFYDTRTGALTRQGGVGDPAFAFATGISATGRVSAVHGAPPQAGLWTKRGGWLDLGSPYPRGCGGAGTSGSWDVSADGHVTVGILWNGCNAEAFWWTDAGGRGVMTPLQVLGHSAPGSSNPPSNRASAVSDDGRVAGGFAQNGALDRWPALWWSDGTAMTLDAPNDHFAGAPGEVLAVSSNGRVAAGSWGMHGFIWTKARGTVDIGTLPGFGPLDQTFPNAIAANGGLVFGGAGNPFFSIPAAFVWTPTRGMRVLASIVRANGVPIPDGYILTNVMAASVDASVLLGVAWDPAGQQISFVLRLPPSAYGL